MRKCFNVKRSPILQAWSRRPLSTRPNGGAGNLSAELDAAPDRSGEVEEKFAAMPLEQLDYCIKQELGNNSGQQGEIFSAHELPLSPIMDPRLLAARNRHTAPKPQPSGPPSALTAKLQKNPYGITLRSQLYLNPANHPLSTSSSDPNPRMQLHRCTASFCLPPRLWTGQTSENASIMASPRSRARL